jgi:hypothetical protein
MAEQMPTISSPRVQAKVQAAAGKVSVGDYAEVLLVKKNGASKAADLALLGSEG